ncbi:helix-turn-helix domain-containing protein [Flavobacterium aquatile]|uniref:AraC family transcriptional regulator n=1 Tax=Flavobacterium aquatile LMG 4008 = ATCC 11947 TaxID=1453498 RepID=A0A095SXQ5_9FLAO|nr:AraC family transcriptional regulator [Flavobacterium aquatile]KGD69357.1 AraC family transcriptional regulator [Flavobacterium aquatile LMG 4008 = ATCC 11947]OXA66187.1 AraC family transcriptional regulator [Flavobacterium aquatile LMG 4008 = ATCC 11947]
MKLHIKNMVCNRCKIVVKSELEKLGLHIITVNLGNVEILEESIENQKEKLEKSFQLLGFELLDNKISKTVERIKNLIIDLVHNQNTVLKINLSQYLSQDLLQDYNTISNLFSDVEGTTIEHYYISQKIEKVKELLIYDELSLSQIADKMQYSDVAHLSNQFKKVTGFTPTAFKRSKNNNRIQIEDI